jgi:hypothetical protein
MPDEKPSLEERVNLWAQSVKDVGYHGIADRALVLFGEYQAALADDSSQRAKLEDAQLEVETLRTELEAALASAEVSQQHAADLQAALDARAAPTQHG